MELAELQSLKKRIGNIVYIDCLPTPLVTDSLKNICDKYDNLQRIKGDKERQSTIRSIKNDMDLINKRAFAAGGNYEILQTNGSPEDIENIAKTISAIYVIPHRLNLDLDYIGFAYGNMLNISPYDKDTPSDYFDDVCNVIFEKANKTETKIIWESLVKASEEANYLMKYQAQAGIFLTEGIDFDRMLSFLKKVDDMTNDMGKTQQLCESDMNKIFYAYHITQLGTYANEEKIEQLREPTYLSCETTQLSY